MPRTRGILAAIAVVALIALVATASITWYRWAVTGDRHDELTTMAAYAPDRQEKAAGRIVAGLNSHDPSHVEVMRNFSNAPDADADNAAITENITAAMPPFGCNYLLLSVTDSGEQPASDTVPWFTARNAHGFDMHLTLNCPDAPPVARTIRVIAIPAGMGGYWAEASLIVLDT